VAVERQNGGIRTNRQEELPFLPQCCYTYSYRLQRVLGKISRYKYLVGMCCFVKAETLRKLSVEIVFWDKRGRI